MEIDFTHIVRLFDRNHKEIPIQEGFPKVKEYDKYKIKDARRFHALIEVKDDKGTKQNILLFQYIDIGGIGIWVSDYLIRVPMYIYCVADSESLELHTTLLGETQYRLKGFDWRRIKAGQYNLIYLPSIENEVYFRGFLKTFDLHIDKELFFRLANELPGLQPLADSIQAGEMNSLHKEFSDISIKAIYQIAKLAILIEEGKTKYPEAMGTAISLIKEILNTVQKESRKYRYTYDEVVAIYTMSVNLQNFMHREAVLSEQLIDCYHKSRLTKDKIREGFQLIFGSNPKHYLLSLRMETGKKLLQEGFQLQDISERTGYSKVSHFEAAFLKYFKCPVKEFR